MNGKRQAGPGKTGYSAVLSLAALGIVYGDIGTSPLYAIRESFSGQFGVVPTPQNVLGVLSLVFWSLVLVVSVKYVLLVLRADNEGEGGILALTALANPDGEEAHGQPRRRAGKAGILLAIGLFGAALLYGDGILTPAISVLSAVEGLEVAQPGFGPYVIPLTVAILVSLFLLQRRGTASVGMLFGPVTLVWFAVIAALGVRGILKEPGILAALNPGYAGAFFVTNGLEGFLVLGAIFLVVTGAEALYADLGHFGRSPIRVAWFAIVFPALLLNYFGQGALVLSDPTTVRSPFFLLAPEWGRLPLVGLATLATIVASQAVITGVFSLTMQAVQLGYWPRLRIEHTSARSYGQIYVPSVNWALMLSTVVLVLAFGSSSRLAGAYGLAIVSTMLVTTLLLFVVAPSRWGWNPVVARGVLGLFLVIELAFLGANLSKIHEGGWVPLVIAAALFVAMTTWRDGRHLMGERISARLVPIEEFLAGLAKRKIVRVPGVAIYMTGNPKMAPPPLATNLEHQKTLHERVFLLTIQSVRVPRVRAENRLSVETLDEGFHRVVARYGFTARPNALEILDLLRERGFTLPLNEVTFFVGRERLVTKRAPYLLRWRVRLFSFMVRNSQRATAFFNIPTDRVVEVGAQYEV